MKKLYKRLLAVVLCLALTAAIAPATVFASYDREQGRVRPGVFLLKLKEQYLGNLRDLFPEIGIEAYTDERKTKYFNEHSIISSIPPQDDFGMYFIVHTSENTSDAVIYAMAILENDPLVEYVAPIDYIDGEFFFISFYEPYNGDIAELLAEFLPDIEIESVREETETLRSILTQHGKEFSDSLKARINTEFRITLVEKTGDAVLNAVNRIEQSNFDLIKSVYPLIWQDNGPRPLVEWGKEDNVVIDPPVDDKLTVAEALDVLRVAAGLAVATPEEEVEFDKDGDGEVTVNDALIVLRIAAGLA